MTHTLITNWKQLIGKTVSEIHKDIERSDKALIHFTDGTCALISSCSDMESEYHSHMVLSSIDSLTLPLQFHYGFISKEEFRDEIQKEKEERDRNLLERLKREHAGWFK